MLTGDGLFDDMAAVAADTFQQSALIFDEPALERRRPHPQHLLMRGRASKEDEGRCTIQYAEDSNGLNAPLTAIAAFCEGVLLDAGLAYEAYARYAVEATYATSNLATFKAIVKKYPGKSRETILRGLVANQPGQEGKWFAPAKDAGFFDGGWHDGAALHRQWMGLRHHRRRRAGRVRGRGGGGYCGSG